MTYMLLFCVYIYREFCGMVKKLYIISPEEIEKGDGPCAKEGFRTGEEHGNVHCRADSIHLC
jgi:hypothetical protein